MSDVPEFAKEEKQVARSKLRETFLRNTMKLQGKPCTITTHEKTKMNGEFKGLDVDGQELLFNNLETPTGNVPHAIVRANDIICIEFIEKIEES